MKNESNGKLTIILISGIESENRFAFWKDSDLITIRYLF